MVFFFPGKTYFISPKQRRCYVRQREWFEFARPLINRARLTAIAHLTCPLPAPPCRSFRLGEWPYPPHLVIPPSLKEPAKLNFVFMQQIGFILKCRVSDNLTNALRLLAADAFKIHGRIQSAQTDCVIDDLRCVVFCIRYSKRIYSLSEICVGMFSQFLIFKMPVCVFSSSSQVSLCVCLI